MCIPHKPSCYPPEVKSAETIDMDIGGIMPATKARACRRRSSGISSSSSPTRCRTYVEHNYCDHSHDLIYRPGDFEEEAEEIDAPKRRGPRGGVVVPFPERLNIMLTQVAKDGFEDIVSWQPHGRCFIVHQPKRFVDEVMPKYFRQSKLTSFQRQVNLYGFRRLTTGRDRGAYYHELFLRGRPDLHKRLVRIRVKGTGFKSASSPATEPNFYIYPRCVEGSAMSSASESVVEVESETPPHDPTTEPTASAAPIGSIPALPGKPSRKPLSAPPSVMAMATLISPMETQSMETAGYTKFVQSEFDNEVTVAERWGRKCGSSGLISLGSMAKDIASCSSNPREKRQQPCPVTPVSLYRQLVSGGLDHGLAMVSPVESLNTSPFNSMLSFTDIADGPSLQDVPPLLPDLIESRLDTVHEGINALLTADFGEFNVSESMFLETAESNNDYSLDPLFLLDDIVGFSPFP